MKSAVTLFFTLSFSTLWLNASAQRSVEAYGFVGYSGVDVEKWAGTGFTINDYDQFNSGYYLQVFPYGNELFAVGIEYGYSYILKNVGEIGRAHV